LSQAKPWLGSVGLLLGSLTERKRIIRGDLERDDGRRVFEGDIRGQCPKPNQRHRPLPLITGYLSVQRTLATPIICRARRADWCI
jgi:hypothetical protein